MACQTVFGFIGVSRVMMRYWTALLDRGQGDFWPYLGI